MTTNYVAGVEFKNRVIECLQAEGLPAKNPLDRRLSELIGTPSAYTDIEGLGPWVIDVRTSARGDISAALSHARDSARLAESDWYVSIIGRRYHLLEDAFVVLPLRLMARIFAGHAPDPRPYLSGRGEQLGDWDTKR